MENKFSVKNKDIFYEDKKIPQKIICDILNTCEQCYSLKVKPSECLDFTEYECEYCHRKQYSHTGLWSSNPYLFFCSIKCHNIWQEKQMADRNELSHCPICGLNKMTYVGRADCYFCYGCEKWYEPYMINMEYDG